MDRVEQLAVYQLFYALAVDVEKATRAFKADFQWLRIQVLKSSESVCANMSEGYYAQYSTEYLQALYRCRREARESMVHLRYATTVGQSATEIGNGLLARYEDATRLLAGLITSIERKISERGKSRVSSSFLKELEAYYAPMDLPTQVEDQGSGLEAEGFDPSVTDPRPPTPDP